MKFKRQTANTEVTPNLTPLIDVVFLLLIFFMVSTTFTKETHLNLNLPEANTETKAPATAVLEFIIGADGSYSLNGKTLAGSKIDVVKAALSRESGGDTAVPMIITADADARHQAVVTVMDAAGQLGFTQLSITTVRSKTDAGTAN